MKLNLGMKVGFIIEFIGIILMLVCLELKSNVPAFVIVIFLTGVVVAFVSMMINRKNRM